MQWKLFDQVGRRYDDTQRQFHLKFIARTIAQCVKLQHKSSTSAKVEVAVFVSKIQKDCKLESSMQPKTSNLILRKEDTEQVIENPLEVLNEV